MTDRARTDRQHWLNAALTAAGTAAAFIAEQSAARESIVWIEKSATDFVSAVDIGAEQRIRESLLAAIPGISIVGEELGPTGDPSSGLVAVVDPLDGTTNFLHGYPAYAVSIGIVLDGVPIVGVVSDVARGGVYSAVAGEGAFRDGVPIRCSTTSTTTRALVGTGFPFKSVEMMTRYLAQLHRLMPQVAGMRRCGSAALDLCDLAAGRFDAFWELGLAPWDIAAGLLIVREAGGTVTNLDGEIAKVAHGPIIGSNSLLHPWFLAELQQTS